MTEIIKHEQQSNWMVPTTMEGQMKLATQLSKSRLIPKDFQGKPDECLVALMTAEAIQTNPMVVFQNIEIIHGNIGFKSKFLVHWANQKGGFKGRIQYRRKVYSGTQKLGEVPEHPVIGYQAYVINQDGQEEAGPEITTLTCIRNGWDKKNPQHWVADHENMLRWRAAKRLIDGLGIMPLGISSDELRDYPEMDNSTAVNASQGDDINTRLGAVTVEPTAPKSEPKETPELAAEDVTFEDVQPEPEPPKAKAKKATKKTPKPEPKNPIDMVPESAPDPAEKAPPKPAEGDLF